MNENQIKELLSKYFITPVEYRCSHCGSYPPDLIDASTLDFSSPYKMLFLAFKEIRTRWGSSLTITSGYRCKKYEQKMFGEAVLRATNPFPPGKGFLSAHLFGLALDIDGESSLGQKKLVEIARAIKPRPRIGWQVYQQQGKNIIHIDFAYLVSPRYELVESSDEW